jgi:pSer/pThr/pTyr-binding forkhead associated (FHA) protein
MQVVLEGSLRYFPPAQILAFLAGNGHGGTLDVESGGSRARIFFEKGKVVAAEAADTSDSREAALEIFSWNDGKFTFLDSSNIPGNLQKVSIDVEPLVSEGLKRAQEGMLYADDDMLSVVDNLAAQDKITMSPDEFKLLFKIGAGKAFRDLLGGGVKRRDIALKLHALEGAGLVKRAGGSGGGARVTSPVPAPAAPKPQAAPQPKSAGADTGAPPRTEAPKPEAQKQAEAPKPAPAPAPAPPRPAPAESEATVIGELPIKPADLKKQMEAKAAPKELVGVLTPEGGGPHPIVEDETTIGRDNTNAVAIPDGSVSTKHARILRGADGFEIEDLGSRNGTFVNGEKVGGKRPLKDGDLLRLGKIILTFNLPKEAESGDATGNRTMFQKPV